MRFSRSVVAALTLVVVSAGTAMAQSFSTSFGGAGYSCLNQDNAGGCTTTSQSRPASFIWNAGDYWRQSVTGSGLASIQTLDLSLNTLNTLNAPNTLTFDVYVNGLVVGSTATFLGVIGDVIDVSALSFSFASISAATYDVEVRVSSPSVPGGGGSVGLFTDGASTIRLGSTTVPEPSTYALMAAGLAGIFALRRRRAV